MKILIGYSNETIWQKHTLDWMTANSITEMYSINSESFAVACLIILHSADTSLLVLYSVLYTHSRLHTPEWKPYSATELTPELYS